jgi:transposase
MARYVSDRSMDTLFVEGSLDSLLPETSLARLLLAALESLDFSAFEAKYRNDELGRPALPPRRLAALWILAMTRGTTSSVALADLCGRDIEFRWLLGGASVQKSTLCDFRRNHTAALADLSTQILVALARSGRLPGRELVLDGTIVRAASSCGAVRDRKSLRRRIGRLRLRIGEALESADTTAPEAARLQDEVARLTSCIEEMDAMGLEKDEDRINMTEREASLKKLKRGGFGPAHNVQAVSDAEGGAIINVEVVVQGNDQGQLAPQLEAAEQVLDAVRGETGGAAAPVRGVAADSAYHHGGQLERLAGQKIEAAVPDGQKKRRPKGVSDGYLAENFVHDESTGNLVCPRGQQLRPCGMNEDRSSVKYRASSQSCDACPARPECCPASNKNGRSVNRPVHAETIRAVAEHLKTPAGKWRARARSVTSEGVFARMIERLHWRRCRMWGRCGALAEARWRQIAHNLFLLTGYWEPITMKTPLPG